MEISGLFGIGGFIVDLFSFPAADDQPGRFQLPEMMGDRRAAHIRYSRKIDNALLAVTQQPKNTEPASVTQLLEKDQPQFESFPGWACAPGSARRSVRGYGVKAFAA